MMMRMRAARGLALACAASRPSAPLLRNGSHIYTRSTSTLASPSLAHAKSLQALQSGTAAAVSTAVCMLSTSTITAEADARVSGNTIRREGLREGMPEITLYQYEVCPFCNKVRAFLDFHNVPYKVVEVDPLRKGELKFSKEYRMVPIAMIDGNQVNGSQDIISAVDKMIRPEAGEEKENVEEEKWVKWTDDHLIHLISPNIYRTPRESMQAFEYIADNSKFGTIQRFAIRYSGAMAMYFIAKKIKKKYSIEDAREDLYKALDSWMSAVKEHGGSYLGGKDGPNVADLSIYGVLKACEKFDTFRDVRENSREFTEWFDKMKSVVGEPGIIERM
eukprot:Plantae.Rhodophyta-Hildenbrandia_rubra.ctg8018.p1 GENE.Plantae.Rhodophyta-Hildenbrandia_rubra.ctg8018~~Plantae.Rhodophyta-Hildenbrandia_rubra.ctg8018.p1  ORF type:complete len:333 (+),score=61.09 Plantae.Rhodophyta-Hildenbrandia_rubra.ctg8018:256-1254(+)